MQEVKKWYNRNDITGRIKILHSEHCVGETGASWYGLSLWSYVGFAVHDSAPC